MADSVDENKKSLFDAESYENNPEIEKAWIHRAIDHMEVHFNLITAVEPKTLKLTRYDDAIYNAFQEDFPDFRLDEVQEDSLKSKENKLKWRAFCQKFKDKIEDSSFGVLVRIKSSEAYNEENTIFVVRLQFLAIEIARNRRGLNDYVYESHRKNAS